jgi:two-component system, chemotaxis family, sensor kinase CheA
MPYSKKLSRQIVRYLGLDGTHGSLQAVLDVILRMLPTDAPPDSRGLLEKFQPFLDVVDASYEKYEENLAIAERNIAISSEELLQANRSIRTLVNSLGQGFLMFDQSLICSSVYSQACEQLLETSPAGKHIAAVLGLDENQTQSFVALLHLVFRDDHAMSFDEILRFAPNRFAHSGDRQIRLDYKNEKDRQGKTTAIVVIATDVTELIQAEALAAERKAKFESIEYVLRDRTAFGFFMLRACDFTELLGHLPPETQLTRLWMEAHTLKAGAGMFRMRSLMNKLHDFESALKAAPESATAGQIDQGIITHYRHELQTEIEVIVDRFKQLLDMDILKLETERTFDKAAIYNFAATLAEHGLMDIRKEFIRTVCAEPLSAMLRHWDVYLKELAERFNKKVRPVAFSGGDILVVSDHYRSLFQSLIHLFRNIMDHGIETPSLRREAGKDEAGLIKIAGMLRQDATGRSWLCLEIADDGAGVNIAKLRKKFAALDHGTATEALTDDEVLQMMFSYGGSTNDVVNEFSGRGFGVRAVADEVRKLDGSIRVKTDPGQGTSFFIEVPYVMDLNKGAGQ